MVWQKEDKFSYETFIGKHKTLCVFFILLFVCLSARLFYLQIVKGGRYREISERQRMHNTRERAPRGIIYSSDSAVLADNRFVYVALFYPFKQRQPPSAENVEYLSKILGKDVASAIEAGYKYGKTVKIADNLTLEEMLKIKERRLDMEGVSVLRESRRVYRCPEATSHITGYTGEIRADEIEELLKCGYKMGDYVGRGGIEQFYEKYLRGKDGGWQVEINALGCQMKEVRYIQPEIGASVYSTVDLKLQEAAYEALKNSSTGRGAVVVLDARSGAVRVLVSCPGFDANKAGTKDFGRYLEDKKLSLFNRAIQALYPPGSVFKIITFAAAVELMDINPEEKVQCKGTFKLGDRHYSCWHKIGHGEVDIVSAMTRSCNVYFYQLGLKLGVENLEKYAEKFHLGQKTGIDMPGEKKGFIPDCGKKKSKNRWRQGDTVIFSIGQGALWVTPLQMACVISAVANKGVCRKPYIVDKIVDSNGGEIYSHGVETESSIDLSDKTWELLGGALIEVVESGTGIRSKISGVKIAGKTGTAQNSQGDDHAWFVSYAPADNPEIAMAVIVENGGGGGPNAVPVGRKIYEAYFDAKRRDGGSG